MIAPDVYLIADLRWQFFVTLTLSSVRESRKRKIGRLFAWLRDVACKGRVSFQRLVWCVRCEMGDQTGREHYHVLMGGLPPWMQSDRTPLVLMALWESHGGGIARARACVDPLLGVAYVLKDLDEHGANGYELAKFGLPTQVLLSESASRILRSRVPLAGAASQGSTPNSRVAQNRLQRAPARRCASLNKSAGMNQRELNCPSQTSISEAIARSPSSWITRA